MTALAPGKGTYADVNAVLEALNVTEALAKLNVGNDWSVEIKAAQDALKTMASRGLANGDRFIFKAQELTAINLAIEVHDAQLDTVSVGKMIEAIVLIRNTLRSGAAEVIS
jgi:hypothetical protein